MLNHRHRVLKLRAKQAPVALGAFVDLRYSTGKGRM
jgi:hypothetical protein